MDEQNKNNNINGWTEYGKLVLKELERLNEGQDKLREDMGDIYSTIGGNYGPPTASQLEGVELIKEQMQSARDRMNAIRSKELKKYQAQLTKMEIASPKMEDFKEYVKKD